MTVPKKPREPRFTPQRNETARQLKQLRTESAKARVKAEFDRYLDKMMRASTNSSHLDALIDEMNTLTIDFDEIRNREKRTPGDGERQEVLLMRLQKRFEEADKHAANMQRELFKISQHLQRVRIAKLETPNTKKIEPQINWRINLLKKLRLKIQSGIEYVRSQGINGDRS